MFSITHLWAGVSLPTYNSSLSSLSSCSWSASLSPRHKTIIKLLQSPGNGGKNEWVWLSTCLRRQLGSGWKLKPGSLMIPAWPAWENEPSSQSGVLNLWHQSSERMAGDWCPWWQPWCRGSHAVGLVSPAPRNPAWCRLAALSSHRESGWFLQRGVWCWDKAGWSFSIFSGFPLSPTLAESEELQPTHSQGV